MPFPPTDVPVPGDGDREHCLGEQHPGRHDGQRDGCPAPDVETGVTVGRVAVEQSPEPPEEEERPARGFRGDRLLERRQGSERDHRPDDECGSHRGEQEPASAQDGLCPAFAQGERRSGREAGCDQEPDRRGDLEACVLPGQEDVGRRQRVQSEKARGDEERERDQEHPSIAPSGGRLGHQEAEQKAEERRGEHEPEVGRLVLPGNVQVGNAEKKEEPGERDGEEKGREGRPSHQRAARSSRS